MSALTLCLSKPGLLARVAVLAVAVTVTGCGRYSQNHRAAGERQFTAGRYQEAIAEFDKAVRFSPNDPRTIRQLGLAHFRLGQLGEAQVLLERAEELVPDDPDAQLSLADIYLAQRNADAAARQLNSVLSKHPDNIDGLARLSSSQLVLRKFERAADASRRLVSVAPNDPRGHYLLGLSLRAQDHTRDAVREFEVAARLAPQVIEPIAQLVEMDLGARRLDDALARVQRQISIVSDSAKLVDLLGVVYAARGQRDLAEGAFLRSAALAPHDADPRVRVAQLYTSVGRYDAARSKAAEALEAEPNNAAALTVLGIVSQQTGDVSKARQYYERALETDSTSTIAANNLSLLLADDGGDPGRALKLAETAKASAPDDPHVADTYGWALFQVGGYERAAAILRSSAARLRDAPTVQYHFGMAAAKAGDTVAARQALRLAVNSTTAFKEKDAARRALAALQ